MLRRGHDPRPAFRGYLSQRDVREGGQFEKQEEGQEEDCRHGDCAAEHRVRGAEDDVRQGVEVLLCLVRQVKPVVEVLERAVVLGVGDRLAECGESWSTCVTNGATKAATTATSRIKKPTKTTVAADRRPMRGSSRVTSGLSATARNAAARIHTKTSRMRSMKPLIRPRAISPMTILPTAPALMSIVTRRRAGDSKDGCRPFARG